MTNYNVLWQDVCGEGMDSYFIVGGHITEQQSLSALTKRGFIGLDENMIVSDIEHIWGKKVNNLDEYCPCAISKTGYLFLYSSEPDEGYTHKITRVELVESETHK